MVMVLVVVVAVVGRDVAWVAGWALVVAAGRVCEYACLSGNEFSFAVPTPQLIPIKSASGLRPVLEPLRAKAQKKHDERESSFSVQKPCNNHATTMQQPMQQLHATTHFSAENMQKMLAEKSAV